MEPKERGVLTESIVLTKFLERGIDVSQPFGDNSRYDYIADISGWLYRVQVKTARSTSKTDGAITFDCESTKSNINQNRTESYHGDIDAFVAYYPKNDTCYWIDIEDSPKSSMYLRLEEPDNPSPNINWAEDYKLDEKFDFNRKI